MDRVYVGNLPPNIRIKDIDDFFRPFGKLVYIDVNHRANPIYALVQFDSPRNAFMAVKSRHGYNYEGYTLQLRFAENEVMKRREPSPPPPPPSMFNNYGMQGNRGGFGNNFDNFNNNRMGQNYSNPSTSSSFQSSQWGSFDNNNSRSNMSQYSSNNRMNMGQSNMDNSTNNRSNMSYSLSSGRSNMSQQNMDYSTNNRSNMPYSSFNDRSNMPQLNMMNSSSNNRSDMSYSLNNRSNMSQQNMMNNSNNRADMSYSSNNRSNMPQQNMMNYSSNNRSNMAYSSNDRSNNMPQQNLMNFSNTNHSNVGNWGNNNFGGGNISGNNSNYNADRDPYANVNFEDNYTSGLSGAGRKWFNRYIREGYSAEKAREKALARRTVPYLRDDPKARQIINDPTNAALENIGTTIMSLLSNTAAADNFNIGNQMMPSYSNSEGGNYQAGGDFDMPGPSRGRGETRNAVSRQQYLKSLSILKELRVKGTRNAKDRLSKKYHTQIVSDYERYEKSSDRGRDKKSARSSERKSETQLLVAFKKKKQQLLLSARKLGNDKNNRTSGAFRKRMRVLISEVGLTEMEAKALAVHPLNDLKGLISMKAEYEAALRNKQGKYAPIKGADDPKKTSYQNDRSYLKVYEKYKLEDLSDRIKSALRACVNRVYKHEREKNLPFTKTQFACLLAAKRRRVRKPKSGSKNEETNKKDDNVKDKTNEEHEDSNVKEDQDANEEDEEKKECDDNEEQEECKDNEDITEEQPGEDLEDNENAEQDE